jgi:hypothetical protein
MQIYNQTRYLAQQTMGMDKTGREFLSLVVKGTFTFPDRPGEVAEVAEDQRPFVMADEYEGAPGFSATLWETDFAFRKARCDVILQGAAYAPGGRPAERVRVGVKVGAWSKQLDVVGQREWRVVGPTVVATRPFPFTRQPFSYGTAFGGVDRTDPEDKLPPVYAPNPVGTGWADPRNHALLSGLPLPNTEAVGEEVTSPYGSYRPMAFGPIGRGWPERLRYAGTYDENWKQNIFPFLPPDFDERYYQTAPADQQIDFPQPGTDVTLVNLTPRGREAFRLPETRLPIMIWRGREICFDGSPLPDTLLLDPGARAAMLVWRIEVRMKRIITEFTEAWVGPPTAAMLRARAEGRGYIRDFAVGGDEGVEA